MVVGRGIMHGASRRDAPLRPICILLPTPWEVKETSRRVRSSPPSSATPREGFGGSSPGDRTVAQRAGHPPVARRADHGQVKERTNPLIRF